MCVFVKSTRVHLVLLIPSSLKWSAPVTGTDLIYTTGSGGQEASGRMLHLACERPKCLPRIVIFVPEVSITVGDTLNTTGALYEKYIVNGRWMPVNAR